MYEPVIESAKYQTDYAAQKSLVTYGVKAVFTRPADSTPARSYYAVADISVDGQCACFGHATQCTGPVSVYFLIALSNTSINIQIFVRVLPVDKGDINLIISQTLYQFW